MKRRTTAIVIGIIIGGLFIALGDRFSTYLFPIESPIPTDHTLIGEFIENDIPFGTKLVIVIHWVIAGFIAAIISTFISGRNSPKPMLAVAAVLNVLTLIQLLITQYPKWMIISSFLVFVPVGYIAYFLIRKKNRNEEL